jgi:hypothetical protein
MTFSHIQPGDKALITCDNWFIAPDGRQYRAVFGTVRAVRTAEDSLGVKPNGRSTNWYVEVGNMTIAGCQVHYWVKTEKCHLGDVEVWNAHEGKTVRDTSPPQIYNADQGGEE